MFFCDIRRALNVIFKYTIMNKEQIKNELLKLVSKRVDLSIVDISLNDYLQDDLNMSSLDIFELFIAIEKEFSIVISDEERFHIQAMEYSLTDIYATVCRLVQEREAQIN